MTSSCSTNSGISHFRPPQLLPMSSGLRKGDIPYPRSENKTENSARSSIREKSERKPQTLEECSMRIQTVRGDDLGDKDLQSIFDRCISLADKVSDDAHWAPPDPNAPLQELMNKDPSMEKMAAQNTLNNFTKVQPYPNDSVPGKLRSNSRKNLKCTFNLLSSEPSSQKSVTIKKPNHIPGITILEKLDFPESPSWQDDSCSTTTTARTVAIREELVPQAPKIEPRNSEKELLMLKTALDDSKREPDVAKTKPDDSKREPHVPKTKPDDSKREPHVPKMKLVDSKREPTAPKTEPQDSKVETQASTVGPQKSKTEPHTANAKQPQGETEPKVTNKSSQHGKTASREINKKSQQLKKETHDAKIEPDCAKKEPLNAKKESQRKLVPSEMTSQNDITPPLHEKRSKQHSKTSKASKATSHPKLNPLKKDRQSDREKDSAKSKSVYKSKGPAQPPTRVKSAQQNKPIPLDRAPNSL